MVLLYSRLDRARTTVVIPAFGGLLSVFVALHRQGGATERPNAGDVLQAAAALALCGDACCLCADACGTDDDTGDLQNINKKHGGAKGRSINRECSVEFSLTAVVRALKELLLLLLLLQPALVESKGKSVMRRRISLLLHVGMVPCRHNLRCAGVALLGKLSRGLRCGNAVQRSKREDSMMSYDIPLAAQFTALPDKTATV